MSSKEARREKDKEWVLSQAEAAKGRDPYEFQIWLETASLLYPQNFHVQFQLYENARLSNEVDTAASLLKQLIRTHSDEKLIQEEIVLLSECFERTDDKAKQLSDMLKRAGDEAAQELLRFAVARASGILPKTRLAIAFARRFPQLLSKYTVPLIRELIASGKREMEERGWPKDGAKNLYHQYVVCDILPLILDSPDVQVDEGLLMDMLETSITYYMGCAFSWKESGMHSDVWETLLSIRKRVADRLNWFSPEFAPSKWCGLDYVESLEERLQSKPDRITQAQFHSVVTLGFLHNLYIYNSCVANNEAGEHLLFVEMFSEVPTVKSPQAKKAKKSSQHLNMHLSFSPLATDGEWAGWHLERATILRAKIYKYRSMVPETAALLDQLKTHTHWNESFWKLQVEKQTFYGSFSTVLKMIDEGKAQYRWYKPAALDLLRAQCHFASENFVKSAELIVGVITSLKLSPRLSIPLLPKGSDSTYGSKRELCMITSQEGDLLAYAVHLLIIMLKDRVFKLDRAAGDFADLQTGHLLVLLQVGLPQQLLQEVFTKITEAGSFTYRLFFSYIIKMKFLEEFAYLNNRDEVTLDIMPEGSNIQAVKRTVTRRVEKSVQEDVLKAFEMQARRSNESIVILIQTFVQQQGQSLVDSLQ